MLPTCVLTHEGRMLRDFEEGRSGLYFPLSPHSYIVHTCLHTYMETSIRRDLDSDLPEVAAEAEANLFCTRPQLPLNERWGQKRVVYSTRPFLRITRKHRYTCRHVDICVCVSNQKHSSRGRTCATPQPSSPMLCICLYPSLHTCLSRVYTRPHL